MGQHITGITEAQAIRADTMLVGSIQEGFLEEGISKQKSSRYTESKQVIEGVCV